MVVVPSKDKEFKGRDETHALVIRLPDDIHYPGS